MRYLQSRMADPSRTDLLSFSYIWYQPLSKEITTPGRGCPRTSSGIPVFALLIWLHTPLWRYFAASIRALAVERHRRIVVAALIVRQRRLSRHLRHRVRLFALGLELGGLHVPDPACGEDPAGSREVPPITGRTIKDIRARLDRYHPPARGNRAAVLMLITWPA